MEVMGPKLQEVKVKIIKFMQSAIPTICQHC